MKVNIALSVLLCLGLALACKKDNPSTPPASDVNLKKGLLAYFPFDGNMADSSGNANPTIPAGGAALTYDEHGYANSAFGGTGNGERIVVTNNGSIKFDTAYTISYDFMIRSYGRQEFVSLVSNTTGLAPSFATGIQLSVLGNNGIVFSAVDSTGGCNNDGKAASNVDLSTFIPQPESWYNFIGVFHKGLVQIYINGTLVSTQTGTVTKANLCPNSQLVIGGWWQNDPISINGKLDEIRLYNRVLNADEIAELSKDFQAN
ncbi:MAG TPA: LamG domain-containing protein [Puia sp.]|nr:LamG domain-containing protein [Puia sp.]